MADLETGGPPGTSQCEVTGKWVPDDELITISGKRVCAEGKAELLERLRSGEAMPGEMECPTVMRRFGCMFVDGLVLGLIGMVVGLVFGIGGVGLFGGATPTGIGAFTILFQVVFGMILPGAYFIGFHGKSGQTPGKKSGKLKVVREDGSDIDYTIAFWRFVWYQGPSILATMLTLVVTASSAGGTLVAAISAASVIYYLVNVLVALMDRTKQRAIHDRMAGTRVIRVDE